MKKKKCGFTLAEVLVTLMIIGVIASMTIPGLKKSAEERERVAQIKKAYSTVANATSALETEYGPIKYWDWTSSDTIFGEMYMKQFNITKNCKYTGGCFDDNYSVKMLSGVVSGPNNFQTVTDWYTFTTADGMGWAAKLLTNCSYNVGDYVLNGCGLFEVDINGPQKPNTVGVDVFAFIITKEGAFPVGGCPGCKDDACQPKADQAWACTAKLLKTGEYTW